MKKIEGNEKQVCTELYKQIYEVLSIEMPHDIIRGGNNMNEQKLKEAVTFYAMHHDTMRLPVEWLKYIPCRYEIYYRYSTNDGDEVANVFLYHDEKKAD